MTKNISVDRRAFKRQYALILPLLAALSAVSAGLFVFTDIPEFIQKEQLIRALSQKPINGIRFFEAPSFDQAEYDEALVEAAVLELTENNPRIRALKYAGRENVSSKDLQEAAHLLEKLVRTQPSNPAVLNDLGVVYWGLGNVSPWNYFKALQYFERSAQLAPGAITPLLNLVVGYSKLHLRDLASRAIDLYRNSAKSLLWSCNLIDPPRDFSIRIKELQDALQLHDKTLVRELLHRYADTYRTMALEFALHPTDQGSLNASGEFVLDYFGNQQGDATMKAILAPLRTKSRQSILETRKLVSDGIKAYARADNLGSLRLYELAEAAVANTGSRFDQLWIALNRADTQLRSVRGNPAEREIDFAAAIQLLERVSSEADALNLNWLSAQALVSKSAASMTSRKFDEIVPQLNKTLKMFKEWGTPTDTARPLYYLSMIHSFSGDRETSLALAYESLKATPPDDHIRLMQLYMQIGAETYRHGFKDYGTYLIQQSVTEAEKSENVGLIAVALSNLATIKVGNYSETDGYLTRARALRERLAGSGERRSLDLSLNLICGQVRVATGHFAEAEKCLTENVEMLRAEPGTVPVVFTQSLQGLAQIHSARGDFDTARHRLAAAIEVIESNDAYFAIGALRMSFENERRNGYDAAIGFEYDHNGHDAAWSYTQRYRSKLFLEFLQGANPAIAGVLNKAIDRSAVQSLVPDDVQILEYVILKDRLLIWLLSKGKMDSIAVSITRTDLDSLVATFLERMSNQEDIGTAAEDLYKILIEPIESRLDPHRALAIIPDQTLHRLNFPALRSPSSKKFLIEQFPILESPNLTTLLAGRSGVPSRSGAVSFGAITGNTAASRELRELMEIYPGINSFNGESAVKTAFLEALGRARIFHYAGHSQDASDPAGSSILLDGERQGPNSVTAADISSRRMPTNSVVVLASCDSSVGNSRDGVEVRGLTSAFLISGAGSVVGSLWRVESDSTSRLVLDFHENFAKRHLTVAESLRQTQLSSIKRGDHPYYWSGFVVTGNLSALW